MIRVLVFLHLSAAVLSARDPKQITLATQGTIAGMYITRFRTRKIAAYIGLPYAEPPLEFRRFQSPDVNGLPSWEGVKNATIYTPDCMQVDTRPKKEEEATAQPIIGRKPHKHDELFQKLLEDQQDEPRKREYSEDCLYLNVYVPDDLKVEGYPVMVWLHGGDFRHGSPHDVNPFHLVWKQKVIFVSVAYRLNIFGFFSTLDNEAMGNMGILDQIAALKWVQANIENFGGDPNNVCIFGHGAGAVSVGLHLIAPQSAGLFQKAIAMSGNALSPGTVALSKDFTENMEKIVGAYNCQRKPTYALLQCLRKQSPESLLETAEENVPDWRPILDAGFSNTSTPLLGDLPSKLFKDIMSVQVPILTGFTNMEDALLLEKSDKPESGLTPSEFHNMREEVVIADITGDNTSCYANQYHIKDAVEFFYRPLPPTTNETILRKIFLEFYTDKVHGSPTYQLAKYMSAKSPVYLYRFDLKPFSEIANEGIPDWVEVPHNYDLIFTFGMPHLAKPEDLSKWDYRDKSISDIIMKMWGNFAWYSNPTNSGVIVDWNTFENEKPGFFIIERQNFSMSTPENVNYKAFEFWTDFYPKVVAIGTRCCKEPVDDSGTYSILQTRVYFSLLVLHCFLAIVS